MENFEQHSITVRRKKQLVRTPLLQVFGFYAGSGSENIDLYRQLGGYLEESKLFLGLVVLYIYSHLGWRVNNFKKLAM